MKPFYNSSIALNNDIENFMVSNFYLISNFTGWDKYGTCPILTPGISHFYPKLQGKNETSAKTVF